MAIILTSARSAVTAVSRKFQGEGKAWSNPTNVKNDDGTYARVTAGFATETRVLETRYDFSDELVDGILIEWFKVVTKGYANANRDMDILISPSAAKAEDVSPDLVSLTSTTAQVTAILSSPMLVSNLEDDLVHLNMYGETEFLTTREFNIDYITVEAAYDPDIRVTALTRETGKGSSVGVATNAWSNLAQVTANDGMYAEQTVGTTATTQDYLHATEYTNTVPSSTIIGIEVEFETVVTADINLETAQLIISGVRSGDQLTHTESTNGGTVQVEGNIESTTTINGVLFISSDNNNLTYKVGGPAYLWGLSLTDTDLNKTNFGVALRFRSASGNPKIKVDNVTMRVFHTEPISLEMGDSEYVHEMGSPGLVREFNVAPQTAEFGHEMGSPFASTHTPENRYGWEASPAVKLTKILNIGTAEFDHEIGSVALTQIHNLTVQSAEFDHEIVSVPATDPTFKSGFEVQTVGITQTHELNVQSSEYAWELDGVINYYDSTRTPQSAEFDHEMQTASLTQEHNLTVNNFEVGHEIKSVGENRYFVGGTTPIQRTKIVDIELRKVSVIFEDRRLEA